MLGREIFEYFSHPNEACFVNKDGSYWVCTFVIRLTPKPAVHPDLSAQIDTQALQLKVDHFWDTFNIFCQLSEQQMG